MAKHSSKRKALFQKFGRKPPAPSPEPPRPAATAEKVSAPKAAEQADRPRWREGQGDIERFFFPLPGATPSEQEAAYRERWSSYRRHAKDKLPAPHERIFRMRLKVNSSGKLVTAEVGKQLRSKWSPVVAFFLHQMTNDPEPVVIIEMLQREHTVEIPAKHVQKVWLFYDPEERARKLAKMTVKEHIAATVALMHTGDERDLQDYEVLQPSLAELIEFEGRGLKHPPRGWLEEQAKRYWGTKLRH